VPILDRYLEAMSKHQADALVFRTGAPVEMSVGGAVRPVSSRTATQEQIAGMVAEVLGQGYASELIGGEGAFPYDGPFGGVTLYLAESPAGMVVRIQPAPAAAEEASELDALAAVAAAVDPHAAHRAARAAGPAGEGELPKHLDEFFHQMLDAKASDLHLKSGRPPMVRIDGGMQPLPERPALDPKLLEKLVDDILPERNRQEFEETNDTDFAYALEGRGRMRCNVFRDLAGVGAVFRQIPQTIRTAKELGLPKAVLDFCAFDKGLVVVTGPTGSGKSTTLAAMIDFINETRDDHLITIEDPIEFVHADKRCLVNQREIGTQTRGFKSALRAALREDPDIVLVGEMRDLETVAIAIETAETGHLVFGTLHTNTAASTVDRLIDQFPSDRQAQVRAMLSESLKGVVAQTLLRKKGGGRVAALEILVVTGAIANLIREGKTFQIPSMMQTGRGLGMQTLSDAMIELVKNGTVEPQEAWDRSPVKKEFGLLLTRSGFKGPWSSDAGEK
jgi:twitching motility protein PilT